MPNFIFFIIFWGGTCGTNQNEKKGNQSAAAKGCGWKVDIPQLQLQLDGGGGGFF